MSFLFDIIIINNPLKKINILLFEGSPDTGKSQTIHRTTINLQSKRFKVIAGSIPAFFKDLWVVLKGIDKSGKTVSVIINSATDTTGIIRNFRRFYNSNRSYDILISSVRDDNFWPRKEFFKIMGINPSKTLEIPFAKITQINKNRSAPLKWCADKIDLLIEHTLSQSLNIL